MRKIKSKKLVSIIGAGILAVSLLSGCGADIADGATTGQTTSETETVAENTEDTASPSESNGDVRVITVVHDPAYVPYGYVTDDGGSDGFEVAVLREVDKLLPDYEFTFQGTSDDDLLIGTESGKYQIGIMGAWWTEAREDSFIFPENYLAAAVTGLVFKTEYADQIKDMESFADFSGKMVPLAPSNAQYSIIENWNKNNPDHQIDLVPADSFSSTDEYQWVIEGRYDAVFDIDTIYKYDIESEDGEYHAYADQLSFVPYEAIPTWPLFNKNEQDLAEKYDAAIETLRENGTLEKLSQEYFGYSIYDYVPDGYKKGDEL